MGSCEIYRCATPVEHLVAQEDIIVFDMVFGQICFSVPVYRTRTHAYPVKKECGDSYIPFHFFS